MRKLTKITLVILKICVLTVANKKKLLGDSIVKIVAHAAQDMRPPVVNLAYRLESLGLDNQLCCTVWFPFYFHSMFHYCRRFPSNKIRFALTHPLRMILSTPSMLCSTLCTLVQTQLLKIFPSVFEQIPKFI